MSRLARLGAKGPVTLNFSLLTYLQRRSSIKLIIGEHPAACGASLADGQINPSTVSMELMDKKRLFRKMPSESRKCVCLVWGFFFCFSLLVTKEVRLAESFNNSRGFA